MSGCELFDWLGFYSGVSVSVTSGHEIVTFEGTIGIMNGRNSFVTRGRLMTVSICWPSVLLNQQRFKMDLAKNNFCLHFLPFVVSKVGLIRGGISEMPRNNVSVSPKLQRLKKVT